MKEIIKKVLDSNGIMSDQDSIIEDLVKELTQGGYIHIDSIKLDSEKIILCVSKIMNELQNSNPIIIEGYNEDKDTLLDS